MNMCCGYRDATKTATEDHSVPTASLNPMTNFTASRLMRFQHSSEGDLIWRSVRVNLVIVIRSTSSSKDHGRNYNQLRLAGVGTTQPVTATNKIRGPPDCTGDLSSKSGEAYLLSRQYR